MEKIWEDVESFQLPDVVFWKLEKSQKFSVKSMYNAQTSSDAGIYHKRTWKAKVTAKIKIFMWLIANEAILTEDNLIK